MIGPWKGEELKEIQPAVSFEDRLDGPGQVDVIGKCESLTPVVDARQPEANAVRPPIRGRRRCERDLLGASVGTVTASGVRFGCHAVYQWYLQDRSCPFNTVRLRLAYTVIYVTGRGTRRVSATGRRPVAMTDGTQTHRLMSAQEVAGFGLVYVERPVGDRAQRASRRSDRGITEDQGEHLAL